MPMPSAFCGRGFFRLERSGVRVTEPDPIVEPLDMVVTVVFIDWTLPLMLEYGRPLEAVTAIPFGVSRKPGLLYVVDPLLVTIMVGSPSGRFDRILSYSDSTSSASDSPTVRICR
uniref:(northern house mosquito) hypothetical protein n=1 Tax=Culex pipiens TaxID=7175 RepID=A0A8D8CS14_CULPI